MPSFGSSAAHRELVGNGLRVPADSCWGAVGTSAVEVAKRETAIDRDRCLKPVPALDPDKLFEEDIWDQEHEVAELGGPFAEARDPQDPQDLGKGVLPSAAVAHSVLASGARQKPIDCLDSTHFRCSNRSFSCAHRIGLGVAAAAVAVASPTSLTTWFAFADPFREVPWRRRSWSEIVLEEVPHQRYWRRQHLVDSHWRRRNRVAVVFGDLLEGRSHSRP